MQTAKPTPHTPNHFGVASLQGLLQMLPPNLPRVGANEISTEWPFGQTPTQIPRMKKALDSLKSPRTRSTCWQNDIHNVTRLQGLPKSLSHRNSLGQIQNESSKNQKQSPQRGYEKVTASAPYANLMGWRALIKAFLFLSTAHWEILFSTG